MFPLHDTVPRRHPPVMTWLLIAATLLAFAFEVLLPARDLERLVMHCGVVPARYTDPAWARRAGYAAGDWWPFVSSLFLHAGWLHLVANLWVFWIFGDNVEDRLGPLRHLLFYLACGVAASALHVLTNPSSTAPAIGASGAIAGVMGAYFVLFPRARVVVLVPILFWPLFLELPAVVFLGAWFLLQFLSGTLSIGAPEAAGGVAWWAHVGGFLTGILLLGLLLPSPRQEGRRRAR